jgi:hypothetical protein
MCQVHWQQLGNRFHHPILNAKKNSIRSVVLEVLMKRRRKDEQRALIEEWTASGQDMAEFCAERSISMQSFKRWARLHGGHEQDGQDAEVFLPVSITPAAELNTEEPCRIRVGGNMSLECTSRTHPKALETALAAAASLCGLI